PFGLDRTVTLGVVSGMGRDNMNLSRYENFIQTDASINPGNSGGPLFNMQGQIIGINTAIINFAQGIGFAIPSNMTKQVIQQLLARGKVVRGWLGVGIQPVTAELGTKFGVNEGEGVLVNEVFENDPAARAGMKPGDRSEEHTSELQSRFDLVCRLLLESACPHRTLHSFPTRRSSDLKQVIQQLLARGKVVRGWLGVGIQPVTAELGTKFGVNEGEGVLVNEVFENDPAARAGMKPGD